MSRKKMKNRSSDKYVSFYSSPDHDHINNNNLGNQTIFVLSECKIIEYFACVVTFVIIIRGDGEKGTNLMWVVTYILSDAKIQFDKISLWKDLPIILADHLHK